MYPGFYGTHDVLYSYIRVRIANLTRSIKFIIDNILKIEYLESYSYPLGPASEYFYTGGNLTYDLDLFEQYVW